MRFCKDQILEKADRLRQDYEDEIRKHMEQVASDLAPFRDAGAKAMAAWLEDQLPKATTPP